MSDVLRLGQGQILTGIVISKNDAGYLVDLGSRCEGFLPMREYTNHSLIEDRDPMPGDKIEVEVVSVRNSEEAQLLLSRWRVEYDRRWEVLEEALKESPVMQVKGVSRVKGGLMVNAMGLEGFVPVSHLTLAGRGANPQNFVGQNLKVKVLDHDKRKHRLVFSRRVLLEEAENERKAKFYARVHEGDVLEGEVSSLTDFGVFVNLGEMDGLVHHTEIARKHSFKKGDKVTVKVIGIDQEKDRISLSMKSESYEYSPEDVKRYISIIREISPSLIREGYRVIVLCNERFNTDDDTECDIITCLEDVGRIEPCQKIAILPFSRKFFGGAVSILAEKTYELRIICGVG